MQQSRSMRLVTFPILTVCIAIPAVAADITIGNLKDKTGPTSEVGVPYAQGIADAIAYVNSRGGIAGRKIALDAVDYGYQVPRAIAHYKKWSGEPKVAAIHGWGTANAEALVSLAAKDEIPYFSASYSASLTDPTGKSGKTKPAPYNFFYGSSYSDGARALVIWAAEDWKTRSKTGKPKYVHMGANHPFPNSPKAAGEEMARELGFEVLPPVQYAMTPGDYTAQCLTIKEAGADYAFLANTSGSNISLLKACRTAGVDVQFLSNVAGIDENAAKAAGAAADRVVFPSRTGIFWNGDAPGMKTLRAISQMSAEASDYRPVHYIAAVCSAMYMVEAIEWAAENGGVSGPAVRQAMYRKTDWVPAGLEGVCLPSTWAPDDHRGLMTAGIYRMHVSGPTDAPVAKLIESGAIKMQKLTTIEL